MLFYIFTYLVHKIKLIIFPSLFKSPEFLFMNNYINIVLSHFLREIFLNIKKQPQNKIMRLLFFYLLI